MEGLPPVIRKDTRILILGTFPGIRALSEKKYYAHPTNQFWSIMGEIIHEDLTGALYSRRIGLLLNNKIGLWNVYRECERKGSLDSGIRNPVLNDFSLLKKMRSLRSVILNGRGMARFIIVFKRIGYHATALHSTSAANTIPLKEKKLEWNNAFGCLP